MLENIKLVFIKHTILNINSRDTQREMKASWKMSFKRWNYITIRTDDISMEY
jgi:hypothetical protein